MYLRISARLPLSRWVSDIQALFLFVCVLVGPVQGLNALPSEGLPYAEQAMPLTQQAPAAGQPSACPAVLEHEPTPAETAYSEGRYDRAENLYGQELNKHPGDLSLSAAYVHTLLHEGEIELASQQVAKAMAVDPHSALTLTALAELELKQGQPWLAVEQLAAAGAADPCYARVHLIRSRVLRLNSMYASERAEVDEAYTIDPNDPDIRKTWLRVVNRAKEIEEIADSLATMKDIDADARRQAQETLDAALPMLSENTQTCKVVPAIASDAGPVVLPLFATYQDAKHIDGYKVEIQLPQSKVRVQVDTAASGLFISRALADLNGLQPGKDDPQGTVRVDRMQIGPLEFRNCLVGVSEAPFPGKSDGFIGTDIFSSYLITLDQPRARLTLSPLPPTGSLLPVDRPSGASLPAELKDFTPVYHRLQYLLVQATLDGKAQRLFILDSGIRYSAMRPEVAHLVSTTKFNFTNAVQTVSGFTLQIYRDSFDFQLAGFSFNQGHIVQMDTSAIDQNMGIQVAGMLGFDMLHSFVMRLDYRDGLIKLETESAGLNGGPAPTGLFARKAPVQDCADPDTRDRPRDTTLHAVVTGLIDSDRLKPGKEIYVKLANGWSDDECQLDAGSVLYGHVTASTSTRTPDSSELSLMFDRAACDRGARQISLRLIAVVAPPDQDPKLHSVLSAEVAGGSRSISALARSTGLQEDNSLNPQDLPQTIHPGTVIGMPTVKLDPLGGPGCSARIASGERDIRLGQGTQLIFTRQSAH